MNFTNTFSERELLTRVVNLNKDELVNKKLNLIKDGKGGLVVRKRGCDEKELKKEFGDCLIFDVTHYSKSDDFIKFCPQYIHYGIPVPYSEGVFGNSVEGIWEGLKDIKGVGIDKNMFKVRKMNGLYRKIEEEKIDKKGRRVINEVRFVKDDVLGIRKGVNSDEILSWEEGRKEIYIECYNWVLKNKVYDLVRKLRIISKSKVVVLLDMVGKEEWNGKGNFGNGYLIKKFIEEEMS